MNVCARMSLISWWNGRLSLIRTTFNTQRGSGDLERGGTSLASRRGESVALYTCIDKSFHQCTSVEQVISGPKNSISRTSRSHPFNDFEISIATSKELCFCQMSAVNNRFTYSALIFPISSVSRSNSYIVDARATFERGDLRYLYL